MKKLLIAAVLVLAATTAQAKVYSDGTNRVIIPKGCKAWSCMSVSVPGHFAHNVKPAKRARAR